MAQLTKLTPAQRQIITDKTRFRVINCGRRFGKTTLSVLEIIGKASQTDGKMVAYIAPTYQQARDIAWEMLKKIVEPIIITVNESRLEIKIRARNGQPSTIILRGWEAVETLRGQKFDLLVIDEIASMKNFWMSWEEVLRPTLTDNKGEAIFISTPKGFNHFYALYNMQLKDKDYKSFHFTSYDNPFLPKEELDKARLEMSEDRFAQEYLADFRKTQGLVYKEFDREKHLYSNKNREDKNYKIFNTMETLVGVDFGYTNPCALLKIERDSDSNYYVSREWYKTQRTTPEIIEMAKSFGGNKYYPDPAEPDRIEEMRRAKLNIREVSKDVEAGINAVRELFKTNRLFIHESCIALIEEIEAYSYPDKKPDRNENEAPIKENDHACFIATCQVETKKGFKDISNIIVGECIWDGFSWTEVEESGCTGNKKTIKINLSDGTSIEGTEDHPIFVIGKGLTKLGEMKYNDHIWKNQKERLWYLMDTSIIDIQMHQGIARDLNTLQAQQQKKSYIGRFINSILEILKKVGKFIIRMVIRLIIVLKISNIFQKQIIQENTKQQNHLKRIFVNFVTKNLNPSVQGKTGDFPYFATKIVEQISIIEQRKILYQRNVLVVEEKEIPQKITPPNIVMVSVVSVQVGNEEKPVFNLKTKSGMYCVNGVVVSNCDALRYVIYMQVGSHQQTKATTRYSQSAMPMQNTTSGPRLPKAITRYQQL